jgi:hypothetical protein
MQRLDEAIKAAKRRPLSENGRSNEKEKKAGGLS